MRATSPLYALTFSLMMSIVACGAGSPVEPSGDGTRHDDAGPIAPAGDPCNPNLFPC